MRGTISREHPWEVMPDLYFYRDPEEVKREGSSGRRLVHIVMSCALMLVFSAD